METYDVLYRGHKRFRGPLKKYGIRLTNTERKTTIPASRKPYQEHRVCNPVFPDGTTTARVNSEREDISFTLFRLPCGMVFGLADIAPGRPVRSLRPMDTFDLKRLFYGSIPEGFEGKKQV